MVARPVRMRIAFKEGQPLAEGTVKWFSNEKGYGFIRRKAARTCSSTSPRSRSTATRRLTEGQRVEFEVVQGTKGLQASGVRAL